MREPSAFLLDEPLSNLDAKLRTSMRSELSRLHDRLGVTTVYVTHDQVEAMTLGDRVVVLRDGVVQQIDTPQALYRTPANLFVAAFIGSPAMNLVGAEADGERIRFAGHELTMPEGAPLHGLRGPVVLGIRPSAFVVDGPDAPQDWPAMRARFEVVEHLGDEVHASFGLDTPRVVAEAVQSRGRDGGRRGRRLPGRRRARALPGRVRRTDGDRGRAPGGPAAGPRAYARVRRRDRRGARAPRRRGRCRREGAQASSMSARAPRSAARPRW